MDNALMRKNAEIARAGLDAVHRAVERLAAEHAKINFYSVAAVSGINRSTLYRNREMRAMVESARGVGYDLQEELRALREENAALRNRNAALCEMLAHNGGAAGGRPRIEYFLIDLSVAA